MRNSLGSLRLWLCDAGVILIARALEEKTFMKHKHPCSSLLCLDDLVIPSPSVYQRCVIAGMKEQKKPSFSRSYAHHSLAIRLPSFFFNPSSILAFLRLSWLAVAAENDSSTSGGEIEQRLHDAAPGQGQWRPLQQATTFD